MKLRPTTESSEMPSVLNRYLDTDKYQGEIRPLAKAIFYNRFGKHDLFLSNADLDKCGWEGDEALEKVPDAAKAKRKFGGKSNQEIKDGIAFKTPRLIIIRGAKYDDPLFWEDKRPEERGKIYGQVGVIPNLYEEWKNNPEKTIEPPFRKRRVTMFYIVDENALALHKKPISLATHGGASIKLVEKYQQFLEQLEGAFAKAFNQSSSTAFDSKQAAAAIWTPTFGSEEYGKDEQSTITVAEEWVTPPEKPTVKDLEKFFPKSTETIETVEGIYDSITPELLYKRYFTACQDEIKYHALAPGALDGIKKLPGAEALGERDETGALAGGLT